MDCDLARQLLPFARPGGADLEAADRVALDRHFAACPACAAAAAELAFDAGLAGAMRAVPVPDALRGRLLTRLVAARMAIYRGLALRGLIVLCAVALGC